MDRPAWKIKEIICLMTISELELRIDERVNWIHWEFKKIERRDRRRRNWLEDKVRHTNII